MLHPENISFESSSYGWYDFQKQPDIKQIIICGDVCSADTEASVAFSREIKKIIEKKSLSLANIQLWQNETVLQNAARKKSSTVEWKNTWLLAMQK